jgi:hypothetical protein
MFWNAKGEEERDKTFSVGLKGDEFQVEYEFSVQEQNFALVNRLTYRDAGRFVSFHDNMSQEEILEAMPEECSTAFTKPLSKQATWSFSWKGCFPFGFISPDSNAAIPSIPALSPFLYSLSAVIHIPAARGGPQRAYGRTAIGPYPFFLGVFQLYTASIISSWQHDSDERIDRIGQCLKQLGLTSAIHAQLLDDIHIELRVSRVLGESGNRGDLINIADAGFGLSQILPVVVGLLVAKPGQIVYVEEPEIHLHPKAQVALAGLLADAARRGVRVVAETHSALLLLGIQTLVAKGDLDSALVRLHWFERGQDGATHVHPGDLDEKGRFGDWPQDFGQVEMNAEQEYLDASLFKD